MILTILSILLSVAEPGGATLYMWLTFILPPVTGVITWVATRYSRKTQTLEMMQKSIDMLVEKNSALYSQITEQNKKLAQQNEQIIELRQQLTGVSRENAELMAGQEKMSSQLDAVQRENAGLKKQLESLTRKR